MVNHELGPANRIVTGHDREGKAVVIFNGPADREITKFNGPRATLLWGSEGMPVSNAGVEDMGLREDDIAPPPNGSWFRIVDYPPGFPGRRHKTDTLDYAICMFGEIEMELDDEVRVQLKAGDVLIQRGTVHSWINKTDKTCRMAFVLVDAHPEVTPGK